MNRMKKWFAGMVLTVVSVFLVVSGAWAAEAEKALLAEIKQYVENAYVDPVDSAVKNAATIEELFEKLGDPHSGYMDEKQFENFRISSSQEYAGVGMQLVQQEDYVQVVTVFPDTPAEKAGVQPGDLIKGINGEDMKGRLLEEVASLVRGPEDTTVLIEFLREGIEEPVIIIMTRELIHLDALEYRLLEEGIGYIRLDTFTPDAGSEFDEGIEELQNQGMKGLVFDLRQNPGGYLTAALDIGSHFAGVGEPLLHIVERQGSTASYQSLTASLGLPLVVLVDEGSASASEIVAGIVRDSGAGLIIGTTTFGKASVQSVYPLSNGGAVKLTTARYLTPKEQDLNGVGLIPDEIVEDPEQQLEVALTYLREQIASLPAEPALELLITQGQAFWNGDEVALEPVPYLDRGQLLVPLRQMGQIFNIQIDWDGTNNQAVASIGDKEELRLEPGSRQAFRDGRPQDLPVAPVLMEGRLMVPVRVLADFVGADCAYDKAGETVRINW